MEKYKFKGRHNQLPTFVSLILFAVFSAGSYLLYSNSKILIGGGRNLSLIILAVFSLFFLIMLIFGILNLLFRDYYIINGNEIIFSQLFIKRVILFDKIKKIEKINQNQTKKLIMETQKPELKSFVFPSQYSITPKVRELIKYCSYSIPIGYRYSGSELAIPIINIMKYKFKPINPLIPNKEFILVTMKNSQKYLLSPINTNEFIKVKNKLK